MSKLISKIKNALIYRLDKNAWVKKNFKTGYEEFEKTGITPEEAYQAMIRLYCVTQGRFNERFHKKLIKQHPPVKQAEKIQSLIGTFDTKNFETINKTLNRDGYAYFKNKISPEMVSSLYNYALKTPALAKKNEPKVVFDPSNFVSEIYRFDAQDLINNKDIQSLIMDPALINIARNYLGCEPIFDFPAMWWSTSFLKEASEEAAQLYHFDMDRIKWLKIFIYLTDVNADNGPHRYIRGSHLPGTKPLELLERGYARIPDNDLVKYYKPEDFVVVCAESGTIFAGDTQCWHKGTPLKKGHRLVLELEYTSSMFGANYPKLEVKNSSPEFKKFCSQNKFYASNIHFTN